MRDDLTPQHLYLAAGALSLAGLALWLFRLTEEWRARRANRRARRALWEALR